METKKYSETLASNGQNAIANNLLNLALSDQLKNISDLSKKLNLRADAVSEKLFDCKDEMLSQSGAADVIQYLNDLLPERERCKILPFAKPEKPKVIINERLWQLQYMAKANMPLFIGRLEDDWWKEDEFLVYGIENGLIELIPETGFLITEKGKDIVRENGLDMTPDNPPEYYERLVKEYKEEQKRFAEEDD